MSDDLLISFKTAAQPAAGSMDAPTDRSLSIDHLMGSIGELRSARRVVRGANIYCKSPKSLRRTAEIFRTFADRVQHAMQHTDWDPDDLLPGRWNPKARKSLAAHLCSYTHADYKLTWTPSMLLLLFWATIPSGPARRRALLAKNFWGEPPALTAIVHGCDLSAACVLVLTPPELWPSYDDLKNSARGSAVLVTALSRCVWHAIQHRTADPLTAWAARTGPEHHVLKQALALAEEDRKLADLRERTMCFMLALRRHLAASGSPSAGLVWGTVCDVAGPVLLPTLLASAHLGEFNCRAPLPATKIRICNMFARLV